MGQRSHILVRVRNNGNTTNIANYYHWNYGERMVSRAAWGLCWLKKMMPYWKPKALENIWDVNFDMGDYQVHSDLIKECSEYEPELTFREIGFEGDGGLCVLVDEDTIKYAFIHPLNDLTPKTAGEYMISDIGDGSKEKVEAYIMNEKIKTTYNANIKELKKYKLMTQEELDEFLDEILP